jgi:hypothetical protein
MIFQEGEWSRDEYVQLGKAVTKFPPGTVKRWEKIADLLNRPVSEVSRFMSTPFLK